MKIVATSALILLLCAGVTMADADAPEHIRFSERWLFDIGIAAFEPGYDEHGIYFTHGTNYALTLHYRHSKHWTLGLRYRFDLRETDFVSQNTIRWGPRSDSRFYPPDLGSQSHWIGLRIGYDVLGQSDAEFSISGSAYFVAVPQNGRFLSCRYWCKWFADSWTKTGPGLGIDISLAVKLLDQVAVGLEFEFNKTWLSHPEPEELGWDTDWLPVEIVEELRAIQSGVV